MPSGSCKRRKRRGKRALRAIGGGGAADGPSDVRGSIGRGAPKAVADNTALRNRVRQLLREHLEYDDYWLADGNSGFESWMESVRLDEDIWLCDALRRWPVSDK